MKYTEPKITITEFSTENIVTLSVAGASKAIFEAAGETVNVAGAVNVGEILEKNE